MWIFYKAARMQGAPEILLSGLRTYSRDLGAGSFAFGAPTNDVLEVTGQQAETFESIVRRYAALPNAKQSLANSVGAFGRFMTIPFRRGFSPDRYERLQERPIPPFPHIAIIDERWKRERKDYNQPVIRFSQLEPDIASSPGRYERFRPSSKT